MRELSPLPLPAKVPLLFWPAQAYTATLGTLHGPRWSGASISVHISCIRL